MWLCEESVAPPIQEMRLAVALAMLKSGLVERAFSMTMSVLCFNRGMDCGLPVARYPSGTGWFIHDYGQ